MTCSLRVFITSLACLLLASPHVCAQDDILLDDVDLEPIVPERVEDADVRAVSSRDEGDVAEMATLDFGLKVRQRSYNVDSEETNLKLSSALYPSVYIGGSLFPFAGNRDSDTGMEWISGFGLSGNFSYGVDTTVIDEAGVVRRVPTRHLEVDLLLNYRNRINELLSVEASTGVMTLDFVLSFNQLYSSTTYRAWQLGVSGAYSLLPWLEFEGGLRFFPVVGLGVSESEFGQDSSTLGAAIQIAVEADIVAGLYVHGGYELLAFSSDFTGRGARGLESPVTTDVFHSLSIWAGYRF